MRFVFDPLRLAIFVVLFAGLVLLLSLQIAGYAFAKLGLSPLAAYALLGASLAGSLINLPLWRIDNDVEWLDGSHEFGSLLRPVQPYTAERTLLAVNVGGGVIPIVFSAYLLSASSIPLPALLAAVAAVAALTRWISRPVRGLGIAVPLFVAPLAAAAAGIALGGDDRAALAYVAGTCGVLIGADLLRLRDLRGLGVPIAAIGGAGTFDGIFITGIVAALLV